MTAALAAGCGLVGLVIGAVLPIAIERVPEKRSLLEPPFPELAVRREPLRWAIVLATGGVFAGLALRIGDSWELPAFLVLAAALITLSVIDSKLFILPNRIVYPLAGVSIVLLGLAALADGDSDPFVRALACGAGGFLAFLVLHLASPRAMGFGDVKLAFVLGLYLGWFGVGETVLGLFLGFVYGAVIGLGLIATGIRTRKDHVPFGPFLAAGALTAILVGYLVIDLYR
jgi:leader peptidase (prepilin peptidase) / N-methyltransferase